MLVTKLEDNGLLPTQLTTPIEQSWTNYNWDDPRYEHKTPVLAGNIARKRRDACEVYPNPSVWEEEVGNGDFIIARGNTAGAGWIGINKSPWNPNTETVLGFKDLFKMPSRILGTISASHKNAGQQVYSLNIESEDEISGLPPIEEPVRLEILNASQTTTVITVNLLPGTINPLRIGQVVSTEGFIDTRLNVANATVATIVSDTQITLVGNDYTFASTTIASTPGNGAAFIQRREMLGRARNAVGILTGSATATQRRAYVRSQGGVARPTGTLAGSHHFTTATDAGTAAVAALRADAWLPGAEFCLMVSRDHVTYADRGVDANATWTNRARFTQIVPNPERIYKTKIRVRNTPAMSRVVARIRSITKAGSTTTTIQTDGPHGLVTGQYVGFIGVRDTVNFANQLAGLICTVTGTDTLTVVHGSSATAVSYGGLLYLVQGQQNLGGAVTQVAQSISRTNNIVTIIGSANWAAPIAIGNIVEFIGGRSAVDGSDLGLDGVYNVINFATNSLVLEPVLGVPGSPATGSDIVSVNCGGAVVQRMEVRLHALMHLDYDPMLVEFAFKGNADAGEASPVQVANTVTVAGTVTATVASTAVAGTVAVDAAIGNPVTIGLRASNANIAAMSAAGDSVPQIGTMVGVGVVRPYSLPEASWNASVALTGTTAVAVQTAAGAGLKRYPTALQAINTGVATDLIILDGAAERWRLPLPPNVPVPIEFPSELLVTANTALNANLSVASTVRINLQGHTSP